VGIESASEPHLFDALWITICADGIPLRCHDAAAGAIRVSGAQDNPSPWSHRPCELRSTHPIATWLLGQSRSNRRNIAKAFAAEHA
jgi:hypothetical protein